MRLCLVGYLQSHRPVRKRLRRHLTELHVGADRLDPCTGLFRAFPGAPRPLVVQLAVGRCDGALARKKQISNELKENLHFLTKVWEKAGH